MGGAMSEVIRLLEKTGALKTGHFVLSSGLHSDRYCQCAALFEHPSDARRVAELMADRLRTDVPCDVVLAPALGGVLWGYELARQLGVRSLFAERKPGEPFSLRRGFRIEPGQRVLLAEDVVTTGGSVMELVPLVEQLGAEVAGFAVIVDRSKGAFKPPAPLHALAQLEFETWPEDQLPDHIRSIPADKPGSRQGAGAP